MFSLVRMDTPPMSSPCHFACLRTAESSRCGFSPGMRNMQTREMGTATKETNQKTHGQEANWTKIAPMIKPSTAIQV